MFPAHSHLVKEPAGVLKAQHVEPKTWNTWNSPLLNASLSFSWGWGKFDAFSSQLFLFFFLSFLAMTCFLQFRNFEIHNRIDSPKELVLSMVCSVICNSFLRNWRNSPLHQLLLIRFQE